METVSTERRKPVRVPVILQMEALECGAASLAMIMAYYKKWVPIEEVRVACGVSRDGCSALNIVKAAQSFGLEYQAFWYSTERILEAGHYPSIIYWNNNHFAVLCGFKRGFALINDPAAGFIRLSMEEFKRHYAGLFIEFTPGEAFVPDGKKKSVFSYLRGIFSKNRRLFFLVMATSALAMAAGAFTPVITRVFTDEILSGNGHDWYGGFLLFFAGLIVFQFVVSVINLIYVKYSTGKIAVTSNVSFMEHIFRMPMEFFSQRTAGDLSNRQAANDIVASTMIGQLAPILINIIMLVFYLIVMIHYSPLLTVVGVFSMAVNLFVANRISKKRTEISKVQLRDQALLSGATITGIDMVETIKATGSESGFLRQWSGYHAGVIKARVAFDNVNRVLGTIPVLLQSVTSIAILVMGLWSIMQGYMTEGLLLAFQGCMSAFVLPVNNLISTGQSLQEMRASLERIHDVMSYPEDIYLKEDFDPEELVDARKLTGKIEMKHVTFGYSRLGAPVISDFTLTITPGTRVAVIGSSGSGKSTIARLLAGLYQKWEGEILYDGKPLSEIPKPVFCGSVAIMDQDPVLFHDTIENNIKMWDETIEDFDMILASRDADIMKEILLQKDGYKHMIEEGGKNLSGGQQQRLEIARVLAGDPSIVIMDEATSALDTVTECEVSDYLHDRGITCIIIAHRLSTIRDCDEIIVLDHGHIVQQGTHQELIKQDGLYQKLMKAQ